MKSLASRLVAALVLSAVGLFASFNAGAAQAADAPDVYFQKLLKEVSSGNGSAVWNALPESYQDDVHDVIGGFAEKMDSDVWNSVFKTAGKLVKVLKEKKEFILGSQFTAQVPAEQKEALKKNWDPAVSALDTIVNSEIKTLDGLKDLDVGDYLKATGDKLVADLVVAGSEATPEAKENMAKLKNAKVTLVSQEGDKATLKLEMEGEDADEKEFTLVEGKWLPSDMVDDWDEQIEKALAGLEAVKITPEQKAQVMQFSALADGLLDSLLAAKDQASFDQALQGIMAFVPMFGGPGGGAPPAPN
ncbi:MAG: hypothetical protein QM775_33365 [Pirellulales bacterium]